MVLFQRLTDIVVILQLPIGSLLWHWKELEELNIKHSSNNVFLLFLVLAIDVVVHPSHIHDQL